VLALADGEALGDAHEAGHSLARAAEESSVPVHAAPAIGFDVGSRKQQAR
jgi:hypothetical protein